MQSQTKSARSGNRYLRFLQHIQKPPRDGREVCPFQSRKGSLPDLLQSAESLEVYVIIRGALQRYFSIIFIVITFNTPFLSRIKQGSKDAPLDCTSIVTPLKLRILGAFAEN